MVVSRNTCIYIMYKVPVELNVRSEDIGVRTVYCILNNSWSKIKKKNKIVYQCEFSRTGLKNVGTTAGRGEEKFCFSESVARGRSMVTLRHTPRDEWTRGRKRPHSWIASVKMSEENNDTRRIRACIQDDSKNERVYSIRVCYINDTRVRSTNEVICNAL